MASSRSHLGRLFEGRVGSGGFKPTISSGRRIAVILICAVFIAASAFMLVRNATLESQAASWVSARGEVVSTRVSRSSHRGPDGYVPHVRYRYEVGGVTYFSEQVWLTEPEEWSSWEGADEFLSSYPIGGDIEVFHDPMDVQRSSLVRETARNLLWIAGALFGFVGMLSMLFLWKRNGSGYRPSGLGRSTD